MTTPRGAIPMIEFKETMIEFEEALLRKRLELERRTGDRQLLLKKLWNLRQLESDTASDAGPANRRATKPLLQPASTARSHGTPGRKPLAHSNAKSQESRRPQDAVSSDLGTVD